MSTNLRDIHHGLKQPWLRALMLISIIPLLPEYISFVLVIPAAFFAWQDKIQHNRPLQIGTVGKILLIYIGYMLITTLYSKNFLHSLSTVAMWAFFFMVYLIVSNLLTDDERCDAMLLCVTAVAGVVGLIACCQYRIGYFAGINPTGFWDFIDNFVYEILPMRIESLYYYMRSFSTFSNPNLLAEYLMTVAPFVIYFNFCERRKGTRLFCRICLLLTLAGVLFSFSRGGYMALIVLCVALVILNFRHRFAAVSMYLVSAFILVPDEVVKRLLSILPGIKIGGKVFGSITSAPNAPGSTVITTPAEIINSSTADLAVNDRFRIWIECLKSFTERPIFGYGAGIQNTWDMLEANGVHAVHAHNLILQLLMEGGVVALGIMSVLGFFVLRYGIRLVRCGKKRAFWMGFAVLMFAACFFVHGLVDYPLLTPKLIANFMMILAIIERSMPLYYNKGVPLKDVSPAFLFSKRAEQQT